MWAVWRGQPCHKDRCERDCDFKKMSKGYIHWGEPAQVHCQCKNRSPGLPATTLSKKNRRQLTPTFHFCRDPMSCSKFQNPWTCHRNRRHVGSQLTLLHPSSRVVKLATVETCRNIESNRRLKVWSKFWKIRGNLPEWVNGHHGKTARFFRFVFVQFTLQKIP